MVAGAAPQRDLRLHFPRGHIQCKSLVDALPLLVSAPKNVDPATAHGHAAAFLEKEEEKEEEVGWKNKTSRLCSQEFAAMELQFIYYQQVIVKEGHGTFSPWIPFAVFTLALRWLCPTEHTTTLCNSLLLGVMIIES